MNINRTIFNVNVSTPKRYLAVALTARTRSWWVIKKCSILNSVGPISTGPSLAVTRWDTGSSLRPCTSITSSSAVGVTRRITAFRRATNSFWRKWFGNVVTSAPTSKPRTLSSFFCHEPSASPLGGYLRLTLHASLCLIKVYPATTR